MDRLMEKLALSKAIMDKSDKITRAKVAVAATAGTKTNLEMEQKTIQAAYTTGGATIGIAQAETDNSDYTAGRTEKRTVISLGLSF